MLNLAKSERNGQDKLNIYKESIFFFILGCGNVFYFLIFDVLCPFLSHSAKFKD